MYNDFILIGPKDDPAGVKGKDILAALQTIKATAAPFISRGDRSGTNIAELALWKDADIDIAKDKGPWYKEIGQGMGAALNMASASNAYVLSDRGTWLAFKNRGDLAILVEGDKRLFNQYGVMLVNPAKHPHVKQDLGQQFIDWLISPEGRRAIAGYIAALGLGGYPPEIIRPAALALNTLVATIGTVRFARAGHVTWRRTYPFIVLGLPFSILGGATHLPSAIYDPIVGALLIVAAWEMVRSARAAAATDELAPAGPPLLLSVLAGAVIGFVAGVTGIGGGIFIAPLVLALHWLNTRHAAGLSALFNLLNSAAALAGLWSTSPGLPRELPLWLGATALGAILGSWLGVKHLPPAALRYVLSVLLLVGGLWLLAN